MQFTTLLSTLGLLLASAAPLAVSAQKVELCRLDLCDTWNPPTSEKCYNLNGKWNDAIRSYDIQGGCCAFYKYVSLDFLVHSFSRQRMNKDHRPKDVCNYQKMDEG
jgi:hypothetical protein